jgi:ABC-2 type transport system ATP-binding protein
MTALIEIKELTKFFGKRKAVDNVNITIQPGELFGLVGPNGAGKTTTMRMLVTLLKPDHGEIHVGGYSSLKQTSEVRRQIGFMPDDFGVYDNMTVREYLDFFGACYKIPREKRAPLINDLLELVDIPHRRDDMVNTLSRGLKQRLGIARVLIHDPGILILDEPASGLDPRARIEIRELLLEIGKLGKTIIFSSHILADVAELCTRVAIMEAGKIAALGGIEQLNQQIVPHRVIRISMLKTTSAEQAQATITSAQGVLTTRPLEGLNRTDWIGFEADFQGSDEDLQQLLTLLVSRGLPIVQFSEDTKNLEEVFMRATKGIIS